MTDDLRPALHELALQVEAPPLDLAALHRTAGRRRRSRRVSVAAGVAVVLLAAPFAWSAMPEPMDRVAQQPASGAPAVDAPPELVSGSATLRYDPREYDEASAEAALSRCRQLPGLRFVSQLDSLPPLQDLVFAGTEQEQEQVQRCLQAVPAALMIEFRADPVFTPVVLLTAGQRETGPLVQSAGEMRPSADGWVEHDVVLTNASSGVVEVDPFRLAQVLDGRVFASSGLCSYSHPDVGCGLPVSGRILQPGQSATVTVELERDLSGLASLELGDLPLTWPLQVSTGSGEAVQTIELEYAVLSLAPPGVPIVPVQPAPPPEPSVPPTGETQQVTVFFSERNNDSAYCDGVAPVTRTVPATEQVARAALEQLFAGPTPEEERRFGVGSAFAPESADLLNSVRIENGVAYVDLKRFESMPNANNLAGYGTSCGMGGFFGQLGATLRQFPTIRDVRYAFDGDPRAFVEYMQGGCPDEPIPPGDPCDPAPFRR